MSNNEINYLKQISQEYSNEEKVVSKIDAIKALDKKVKTPAEVFAYTFGITSTLIFGLGMCLAMKIIGNAMVLGIIIGVVGMGLILANYPLYKKVLLSRKKKYASEIITLTSEALNENK